MLYLLFFWIATWGKSENDINYFPNPGHIAVSISNKTQDIKMSAFDSETLLVTARVTSKENIFDFVGSINDHLALGASIESAKIDQAIDYTKTLETSGMKDYTKTMSGDKEPILNVYIPFNENLDLGASYSPYINDGRNDNHYRGGYQANIFARLVYFLGPSQLGLSIIRSQHGLQKSIGDTGKEVYTEGGDSNAAVLEFQSDFGRVSIGFGLQKTTLDGTTTTASNNSKTTTDSISGSSYGLKLKAPIYANFGLIAAYEITAPFSVTSTFSSGSTGRTDYQEATSLNLSLLGRF